MTHLSKLDVTHDNAVHCYFILQMSRTTEADSKSKKDIHPVFFILKFPSGVESIHPDLQVDDCNH
jgi:hypothetical protein